MTWDLPWPAQLPVANSASAADVTVRIGNAERPRDAVSIGPLRWCTPTAIGADIPGWGRYFATASQVSIAPASTTSWLESWRLLSGPAFTAVLLLRGMLPVRGCAFQWRTNRGATLIFGNAGTGTTTVGLAALHYGAAPIGDELLVLTTNATGQVQVAAGWDHWQVPLDTAHGFSLTTTALRSGLPRHRYELPVPTRPVALAQIFHLDVSNQREPELNPIGGLTQLRLLQNSQVHASVIRHLCSRDQLYLLAGQAIATAPMRQLRRPESRTLRYRRLIHLLHQQRPRS